LNAKLHPAAEMMVLSVKVSQAIAYMALKMVVNRECGGSKETN
jgi:hypothetical protein